MSVESFLIVIALGAFCGWLAGIIVQGGGLGLIGNVLVGILGTFVADWLLPQIGVHIGTGLGAHIFNSVIGGVVILLIMSIIRRT